jgi:hypothetical protein
MPLRDHFHAPFAKKRSWDEVHGLLPAVIVQHLIRKLPEPYYAAPGVHLGSRFEVDIAAFEDDEPGPGLVDSDGEFALATFHQKPTATLEADLFEQDIYEVRVYTDDRERKLLATIEIVSPSNKDRPRERAKFVDKIATLVKAEVCVSIVDIVTEKEFNLYSELLAAIDAVDPAVGESPPPICAATIHMRFDGPPALLDCWYYPLAVGQPLPTLPIRITEKLTIPLDLESVYEECCRTLRIR